MTNEEFLESISEEGEIWKPVVGYEGRYAVSSFGRLVSLAKLIERHPEDPLRIAIAGMLPHGRLGRAIMANCKIYAGAEHPHSAQNPKALEV